VGAAGAVSGDALERHANRDDLRVTSTAPRSVRVSTLELFFDLVFVFTITQLTDVLAEGHDLEALSRVVVMLLLIWWIYDGYAWLTNAITTDRLRFRLLLVGGMGGFLIIALAAPHAYESDGVVFGLGYLAVTLLHAGMFARGATLNEMRAILKLAPFNLLAAVLVLVGGALGGDAQTLLWAATGVLLWLTPRLTSVEGFVVGVSHFVERHGLVVIVALGESIVVIGVGAEGLELDAGLVLVALLALALNAALWWVYFSDETAVEEGFHAAPADRRAQLALTAFGYWHYGILLAVIAIAAGLKKAVGHPYDPLEDWIAIGLGLGTALYLLCDLGFRRTFGIPGNRWRAGAAVASAATAFLGTAVAGVAQVGALAAILALALLAGGTKREPAEVALTDAAAPGV
jgi:low temperature requirement protein LtrA